MTTSTVKSAERALAVLKYLAQANHPVTTMDIAQACVLPKSSAHHLLNVMKASGFIDYWDNHRAWTLGVMACEVGAAYLRDNPLQQVGQQYLTELTEELGDTTHLAVLRDTDVVYIDKREPRTPGIRLVTEVGSRLPAHLTAVGRAILSLLGDDELDRLYADYDWPVRTGAGPRSLADLRTHLRKAKKSGVAHDAGATTAGISCIAAPVRSVGERVIAAIGVTFVAAARTEREVRAAAAAVARSAREFSADMGYTPTKALSQ